MIIMFGVVFIIAMFWLTNYRTDCAMRRLDTFMDRLDVLAIRIERLRQKVDGEL
jgi:hypothetical protein